MPGQGGPQVRGDCAYGGRRRAGWTVVVANCLVAWMLAAPAAFAVQIRPSFPANSSPVRDANPVPSTSTSDADATVNYGFRITWGGGSAKAWELSIRSPDGNLQWQRNLAMHPASPGWIQTAKTRIEVTCDQADSFGGFDVEYQGPPESQLTIEIADRNDPPTRFSQTLPASELANNPLLANLDASGNRISITRTPGDRLHILTDRKSMVFQAAENFSFRVQPRTDSIATSGDTILTAELRQARSGKPLSSVQQTVTLDGAGRPLPVPFDIQLPLKTGAYDIVLNLTQPGLRNWSRNALQRTVQVIVYNSQAESAPETALWSEVAAFQPADLTDPNDPGWMRLVDFSGLAKPGKATLNNDRFELIQDRKRRLLRLRPGGWMAFPVNSLAPGRPHIIELEYLQQGPMKLGISLLEPDESNQIPTFGLDSGVAIPASPARPDGLREPAYRKHRMVVWPNSKSPLMLLVNRDSKQSAVIGKVRVYAGPDTLAAVQRSPLAESTRQYIAYLEKPLLTNQFEASRALDPATGQLLDDWQTFHEGIDRLVQHLKANNYTGLAITVWSDGSALYPSQLLAPTPRYDNGAFWSDGRDPVRKDVLELLLRVCDQEGLAVFPVLECSAPLPRLADSTPPQVLVNSDQMNVTREIPRRFFTANMLHQDVANRVSQVCAELGSRYAHHSSLAGMAIKLAPECALPLPGARWGMDRQTISEFLEQSGLTFPGDPSDLTQVNRWILQQHQDRWLQWRANHINRWLDQLQRDVTTHCGSQARLFLLPVDLFKLEPMRSALAAQPGRPWDPKQALLELGIDTKFIGDHDQLNLLQPDELACDRPLPENRLNIQIAADPSIRSRFSQITTGNLFVHRSEWTHFRQLQNQLQTGDTSTQLYRQQPLSPGGAWNRARFTLALHESDSQFIWDGGWTLPTGQHNSIRPVIEVLSQLPDQPFQPVPAASPDEAIHQTITVRDFSRGDGLQRIYWFYVTNPNPWKMTCYLDVSGQAEIEILADLPLRDIQWPSTSGRITLELEPFETFGAVARKPFAEPLPNDFQLNSYAADVDEKVVQSLARQLDRLQAKVSRSGNAQPWNTLTNPDFELPLGTPDGGWTTAPDNRDEVSIRQGSAKSGQHYLSLSSQGDSTYIRSEQLNSPETGRLSIVAWVRLPDDAFQGPLRISIDGFHQARPYYRFAELSDLKTTLDSADNGKWHRFAVHFDTLPAKGIEQLRVGFDLMGSGQVDIDSVQLFDRWFDEHETEALSQRFALANYRLRNLRDLAGCRETLQTYWAHFFNQYYNDETESAESIRLPESSEPDNTTDAKLKSPRAMENRTGQLQQNQDANPQPLQPAARRNSLIDRVMDAPRSLLNR